MSIRPIRDVVLTRLPDRTSGRHSRGSGRRSQPTSRRCTVSPDGYLPSSRLRSKSKNDTLQDFFAHPTTFLRLLHYPPQDPTGPDDEFGSNPHTDYGFVTILAQDENGGLQVRAPDGRTWLDAPPRAGAFVLNIGDIGERWSNGVLRSTPHRVLNRTGRDRYSIPYFFDPAADAVVAPLAACVPDGAEPRFDPVTYGVYLLGKLNANHSYRHASAG